MKLEYLQDISDGGKHRHVVANKVVRLYHFDEAEARGFRDAIATTVVREKRPLSLASLQFIVSVNCNLTLRVGERDIGISSTKGTDLYCDLTVRGYETMINLLKPFSDGDSNGYQWLYDVDNEIEFLFSPGGGW